MNTPQISLASGGEFNQGAYRNVEHSSKSWPQSNGVSMRNTDRKRHETPKKFLPHGTYSIKWVRNILIVEARGIWNEQCSEALNASATTVLELNGGKPFALLINSLAWEGATPLAVNFWLSFVERCRTSGLTIGASVMPSLFHIAVCKHVNSKSIDPLPIYDFCSAEEALNCVNSRGFSISKNEFVAI